MKPQPSKFQFKLGHGTNKNVKISIVLSVNCPHMQFFDEYYFQKNFLCFPTTLIIVRRLFILWSIKF